MKTIASVAVVAVSILALILVTEVPSYSQNAVIYGCVKNSNGDLRIVSAPEQCKSNEALISWNQAGVANGITRVVHGIVEGDGTIQTGENFTVTKESNNHYTITFDTPFSPSAPTCTVTVAENINLIRIVSDSYVLEVEADWIVTEAYNPGDTFQKILPFQSLGDDHLYRTRFHFICVK
jgi:hypothetical protein